MSAGIIHQYTYGWARVTHYEAPWRWHVYKSHDDKSTGEGALERVWATGPDDTSPMHRTYPQGYDARCNSCWLGQSHTEDTHARALDRSPYKAP